VVAFLVHAALAAGRIHSPKRDSLRPHVRRTSVIVFWISGGNGPTRTVGEAGRLDLQKEERRTMRKFLLAAALSAGALGLNVGQASAGLFRCCCYRKCCTFYCKPYNAFSPCCCGSVCFNGCCPIQQQPCPPPCPPATCCADSCGGCGGPGFLPGAPTGPTMGTPPTTTPGGQQFTPPAPQQLPQGAGARGYLPARPFMPAVQPVGYYPYVYPYANPYAGYPAAPMPVQPMNVPSYWYQQ